MSDSECASIRTRKDGSAQSIRFSNDKHDDTAWPAVKGYMRQHDDDVTGNYSDDINTILVLVRIALELRRNYALTSHRMGCSQRS